MNNHFAVSMGYCRKLINSNNKYNDSAISRIKAQPIEGIELMLCKKERLEECYLSKENIDFLKKLHYNSIHSLTDCVISEEQLELMEPIYELINARNFVSHTKNVEAEKLLSYNMAASLENERGEDINKLEKTLNKYDQLNFTFDLAHALEQGEKHTRDLIDRLGHKITEVHFSIPTELEPHYFYHKSPNSVIKKLARIVMPDVIIVSEAAISDFSEIELFSAELAYLRSV